MRRSACLLAPLFLITLVFGANDRFAGVTTALQTAVDEQEVSGAVAAIVTRDGVVDLQVVGLANIAEQKPMRPDTVFWLKSLTKPLVGLAILMLQEEGKLHLDDPVAKFIPEFGDLKTPAGQPAKVTLRQMLTHTSGLGERRREPNTPSPRRLADLIPGIVASPMQFEPGPPNAPSRWKYTQSGIITAARIVEIVSGQTYDQFLEARLFAPLGMKDATFYPSEQQGARLATLYAKNKETGALEPVPPRRDLLSRDRPPMPDDGLYATATDVARLLQMLLHEGELNGRRYLQPETVRLFRTVQTGELKAGFTPGCGWGIACGVVQEPQGATGALSPGSFGHGGAYGTQGWVDPVKGVAYVLMIQRDRYGMPGYRNGDDTKIRADFQNAAARATAAAAGR